MVCDLASRDDVGGWSSEAGEIDVAGGQRRPAGAPALTDLTQEHIDRMLEVNLRAPVALARALAPAMVERGRGHMVFISSLAGKAASPASSIYSATKFGLRGFALGMREDLRPHGVGVSTWRPGSSATRACSPRPGSSCRGTSARARREQVAAAVIRAVERNRAEVDVAPMGLRLGASFASVAPGLAAEVSRRMGGDRIALDTRRGSARQALTR